MIDTSIMICMEFYTHKALSYQGSLAWLIKVILHFVLYLEFSSLTAFSSLCNLFQIIFTWITFLMSKYDNIEVFISQYRIVLSFGFYEHTDIGIS